jgi:hypothetical protein
MDSKIIERLLHTCAWCTETIPDEEEVFGFGAKASPEVDLTDKEGEFVSLELAIPGKTVFALVPSTSSRARADGFDLVFLTCSQVCAEALKDALEFEKDVYEEDY